MSKPKERAYGRVAELERSLALAEQLVRDCMGKEYRAVVRAAEAFLRADTVPTYNFNWARFNRNKEKLISACARLAAARKKAKRRMG